MDFEKGSLESLEMKPGKLSTSFWKNKNVLITGHTGFKGSWLSLLLKKLGANVTGISLEPSSSPNLFDLINGKEITRSIICDIRNLKSLREHFKAADPECVLHLAAQPLVRESYLNPIYTFESNIMGTANVLESMRSLPNLKAAVMITTDKVYRENHSQQPYVEDDYLGGQDPYSSSKAACEIVIDCYRKSFHSELGISIASARAGNVIGGGDWSNDRLIPDAIKSWSINKPLEVRYPNATRPWQHVLEPLYGYLILAESLFKSPSNAEAYNFGPEDESIKSVKEVINLAQDFFGAGDVIYSKTTEGPHEAKWLSLDITKAIDELSFMPRWNLQETVEHTISWYKDFNKGGDALSLCMDQIESYENSA